MQIDKDKLLKIGKQVIAVEAKTIAALEQYINDDFVAACQQLLDCQGHAIIIGMGKSGHIANKIAATLASTGTPSFFVHPGEASHGDLGMITKNDVAIAISNSGNTAEIVAILPVIKKLNIPLIAITGNANSTLAKQATIFLNSSIEKEACPMGLAPTSSTTAALAMGDALAIAVLESRGFTSDDFALSHPAGTLGKRLILSIDDLMHTGTAIPKVSENANLSSTLMEMTAKRLGMTTIVNESDDLVGIFTDGDVRRSLEKGLDVHTTKITEVMTTSFKTVPLGMLAIDALQLMEQFKITTLVALDHSDKLIGVVHMHDILTSGIM